MANSLLDDRLDEWANQRSPVNNALDEWAKPYLEQSGKTGLMDRAAATLPAVWKGVKMGVSPTQVGGHVARVLESGKPADGVNVLDTMRATGDQELKAFRKSPEALRPTLFGSTGEVVGDIVPQMPQTLEGLAGGVAGAVRGAKAGPLGAALGGVMGAAPSLIPAYHESQTRTALSVEDAENQRRSQQGLSPLSLDERQALEQRIEPQTQKIAAAEVGTELPGMALEALPVFGPLAKLGTKPLANAFSKEALKTGGVAALKGMGATALTEPVEEAASTMIQQPIERELGLTDQPAYRMDSGEDWKKAFEDVTGPTLRGMIPQMLLGGGLGAVGSVRGGRALYERNQALFGHGEEAPAQTIQQGAQSVADQLLAKQSGIPGGVGMDATGQVVEQAAIPPQPLDREERQTLDFIQRHADDPPRLAEHFRMRLAATIPDPLSESINNVDPMVGAAPTPPIVAEDTKKPGMPPMPPSWNEPPAPIPGGSSLSKASPPPGAAADSVTVNPGTEAESVSQQAQAAPPSTSKLTDDEWVDYFNEQMGLAQQQAAAFDARRAAAQQASQGTGRALKPPQKADEVPAAETALRAHEDDIVKPKIMARLANQQAAVIGQLDARTFVAHAGDQDYLRLVLTAEEKSSAQRLTEQRQRAATEADRARASEALNTALAPAVERALAGERPPVSTLTKKEAKNAGSTLASPAGIVAGDAGGVDAAQAGERDAEGSVGRGVDGDGVAGNVGQLPVAGGIAADAAVGQSALAEPGQAAVSKLTPAEQTLETASSQAAADVTQPKKPKPVKRPTQEEEDVRNQLIGYINRIERARPAKTAHERRARARNLQKANKQLRKLPVGMLTPAGVEKLQGRRLMDSPMLPIWKETVDLAMDGAADGESAYAYYRDEMLRGSAPDLTEEHFRAEFEQRQKAARQPKAAAKKETGASRPENLSPADSAAAVSDSEGGQAESLGNFAAGTLGTTGTTPEVDPIIRGYQARSANKRVITHDGKEWYVTGEGAERDGKTFLHLSSTSEGRIQANGWYPVQINDWVDNAALDAAAVKDQPQAADKPAEASSQANSAPQWVEHTTGRGKTIRGIVRKDITVQEAKQIDPHTFRKDGGFFIREKYVLADRQDGVEVQHPKFITPAVRKAFREWQASGEETYFGEDGRRSFSIEDSAVHDGLVEFGTTSTQGNARSAGGQKVFENRLFFRKSDLEASAKGAQPDHIPDATKMVEEAADNLPAVDPIRQRAEQIRTKIADLEQKQKEAEANGNAWVYDKQIEQSRKELADYEAALAGRGTDKSATAPEHQANTGKALDESTVYEKTATGPVKDEAPVDESIVPLTMEPSDFREIIDEWASLFANPDEKVQIGKKAGEYVSKAKADQIIEGWKQHTQDLAKKHRAENSTKTVLSLFDLSGEWSKPWEEAGYNVIRFDIQSGQDIHDFSVEYFNENYDFGEVYAILAACPCTDFAVSGARHFAAKDADGRTEASKELVFQTMRTIEYFRPKVWALENPVGRIERLTGLPKWRMSFDPHHFGEDYTKKTLIWGNFNADLPTANVEPTAGSKMHSQFGGKSQATKNARSVTPEGFAYSFFMANNVHDYPVEARLRAEYPEAAGAISQALKAGVPESRITELMEDTYGNYEYEEARNALIREVSQDGDRTPPTGSNYYPEYSELLPARNHLIELRSQLAEQGRVSDDRLAQKIRQQEKIVRELEADQAATTETTATPGEGASPPKAQAATDEMADLKAQMGQAIGELASILGAKTNMTPEEETRIIPVMSKIFRIAAKMGYIQFKDAARHVMQQIRELAGNEIADKLSIDNLQAGYINIASEIGGDKKAALTVESIEELMAETAADKPANVDNTSRAPAQKRRVSKPKGTDNVAGADETGGLPAGDTQGSSGAQLDSAGDRQSLDTGLAGPGQETDRDGRVSAGTAGAGGAGSGRTGGERGQLAEPNGESGAGRAEPGVSDRGNLDHVIEAADEVGKGGLTVKYRDNVKAIKIIKALEAESRTATPDERKQLARYVGWGALKGVFDPNNKTWAKQYKELRGLLNDDEWASARASILNAHYTSPTVVESIYDGVSRLGFAGGRLLEPSMGSGNFFGLMPANVRQASQLHGVELDNLTSRLAKALYPNAIISAATGFQEYSVPSDYFDLAIGNPPFGNEKIVDRQRSPYSGFSIHNYFLARMLDKVREGGIVAAVVSHNFMDVPNSPAREWMAERANLLGAVRLPNTAFKGNAGTEVVTDILFFQKTATPEKNPAWVNASSLTLQDKDGQPAEVNVNDYFLGNPKNILGQQTATGTMYRAGEYNVEPNGDLANQLKTFMASLPTGVYQSVERSAEELNTADNTVPPGVKQGSFYVAPNGQVRQRGDDVAGQTVSSGWPAPNAKAEQRMKGMIELRELLKAQLRMERDPEATEKDIEANRAKLKKAYAQFLKTHGYLNNATNRRIFNYDTEAPLVQALEFDYDKGVSKAVAEKDGREPSPEKADEADILNRRVLFPPQEAINVSSAQDALLSSLNLKGRIDMGYLSEVYGKPEAEVIQELGDSIFRDPLGESWQTADEYLSGDVKTKLEQAKQAAEGDAAYRRNVAALEKVIPKDRLPSEIYAGLGAGWIPAADVEAFAREISGMTGAKVQYMAPAATWLTSFDGSGNRELMVNDYGTERMNSLAILAQLLNGKPVEVKDRVSDPSTSSGYRLVTNESETEKAKTKADKIKSLWDGWLFGDPERAERLATLFNDKFNRTVSRGFDGSHLTLPGITPVISLRQHQKNVIWRGIQERNILLDHVVGAGKTFAAVATVMEMKRLGISRKPLLTVPNHLTQQWKSDFARLYPAANVLAAEPDDFAKGNRERLFSKIATGDWDAVIVGHSSLKKIGLDPEIEARFLKQQQQEIADAIEELKRERGDKGIVRDMEKIKANLDAKITDLVNKAGERDKVLSFNELGIDGLVVDEHHEFKNLFFTTQKQRVSGLGNPKGSGKAFDLFFKIRWLQEMLGEKAPLITATGTPVSNSLAEMFTMQRYMRYDELKRQGVHLFDAWANLYGSDEYVYEVAPSGVGYRISQRFAKFKNLPSLMGQYQQFADTVTLQDLKDQAASRNERFPVPKIEGGGPKNIVARRSTLQRDFFGVPEIVRDEDGKIQYELQDPATASIAANVEGMFVLSAPGLMQVYETQAEAELGLVTKALTPRITLDPKSIVGQFENLRQLTRESKGKINALSLTGLASKAGLDMRLIDPSAPDNPGSKINLAVSQMMRLYQQWGKDKGTQLVFCDLSVPASARKAAASQEKRVYVRDEKGQLTHKKGTLHAVEGREGMPFYLVQTGKGAQRSVMVYEAVTGQAVKSGLASKAEAMSFMGEQLDKEANRDKWFDLRERVGAITNEDIAEYRDANEIETDGEDEITLDDLEASSGSAKFSVYDDIKAKLMAQGVPEHEIAFIHDYHTPKKKAELFKRVNRGEVRFLLGSTPKLGAGTNVQQKLVGLHHIDAPWRPSDLEQREGRIIRQGNKLYERDPDGFEVFIGRYATEQTYDTRRWQIIEHKAAGIEQLRRYSGELEIEDVGGEAANAADMKAAASGNPLILEETRLRNEVKRLTALQKADMDSKTRAQSQKRRAIRALEESIPEQEREYQTLIDATLPAPQDSKLIAGFAIDGQRTTTREAAIEAINGKIATLRKKPGRAEVGYRGLTFEVEADLIGSVALFNPLGHRMGGWDQTEAVSGVGLLTRMNNYVEALPSRLDELAARRKKEQADIDLADKVMTTPFAEANDLAASRARHTEVQRRLMKASVMDAVPADEKAAFEKEREARKAGLTKQGYGQAIEELEGDTPKFSRAGLMAGGRDQSPIVQAADQTAASALNRGMVRYFGDKSWENAYVQVELPDALSQFREAVAAGFGRELVGVIGRTRGSRAINGVNYQGKLYLNVNADVGFVQLGGHELLHQLKRDRPDLYRWFAGQARGYYKNFSTYQDKLNALLKPGESPYNVAAAEEELLSDFAGDAFADPQFVEHLAKADPGRFRQLLKAVIDWLKQVGDKLSGKGLGSSEYFTDVETLRTYLADALVAYGQGGPVAIRKVEGPKFSVGSVGKAQPAFYSQLARSFEAAKVNVMPGTQWLAWLRANAAKVGVKADEIAWTGIEDYLTLNAKEKLTKADIASYLNQNGVQVEEVMKGEPKSRPKITAKRAGEMQDDGTAPVWARGESVDRNAWVVMRNGDPVFLAEGDYTEREAIGNYSFDEDDEDVGDQPDTKFSQYTLPGGTNYRELLITLPAAKSSGSSGDIEFTSPYSVEDFLTELSAEGMESLDYGRTDDGLSIEFSNLTTNETEKFRRIAEKHSGRFTVHKKDLSAPAYRSSHWDEPNVLAHIRFDERTDADGKRVMFITELQSDWGQEGKKKGFGVSREKAIAAAEKAKAAMQEARDRKDPAWRDLLDEYNRLNAAVPAQDGVPAAPFVTDTKVWLSLGLKRAIRYAAENGFDKIAFANGQQNADLYDLSKKVDSLLYSKNADGTYRLSAVVQGQGQVIGESLKESDLEDQVGKEIAEKIINGDGRRIEVQGKYDSVSMTSTKDYMQELSGIDLKVGGEGMRTFYDQIVPQTANDVLKKLGGPRVGAVNLPMPAAGKQIEHDPFDLPFAVIHEDDGSLVGEYETRAEAEANARGFTRVIENPKMGLSAGIASQLGFDITPVLQDKALSGMPLFSRRSDLNNYPDERQGSGIEDDPEALFADVDAVIQGTTPVKDAKGELDKRWNQFSGAVRRQWLGALTVHQLTEVGQGLLPRMADYLKRMNAMDVTRNEVLHDVDAIAKPWEALPAKEQGRLAVVMHESTLAGVDGAEAYVPSIDVKDAGKQIGILQRRMLSAGGDPKISAWMKQVSDLRAQVRFEKKRHEAYGRIKAMYHRLTPEAKAVYLKARDYHVGQSRRVEQALVEMINQSKMTGRQRASAIAKLRQEFESQRVQAPYFPLARQGDYWVSVRPVVTDDGSQREFYTYQTIEEQEAAIQSFKAEGAEIMGRGKQLEGLQELQGVPSDFIAKVEDLISQIGDFPAVAEIKDQVYQLYLQSLPDLSVRKHYIHRKKTPGFGRDALRAFASKGYHDAYQLARVEHGFDLKNTMEKLREDIQSSSSKARLADLKRRRQLLAEFRDEVLHKGMTTAEVEARADALSFGNLESKAQRGSRSATSGERFAQAEQEKWAQFAKWMKDWAKYGNMPNWVNGQLKDIASSLDTAQRINRAPRGYEQASNLYGELQQAYAHLMNPQTSRWANIVNQVGYLWHLAFSPAAWVTNATQTPIITMPYVAAKFGMAKTTAAFNTAYKEAMRGALGGGKEHPLGIREALHQNDEVRAYAEAMALGLIERGRAMDLAGVAEEGASRSGWHRKFAVAMTVGFHDAERLNREVSFMASYRLARADGLSHDAAVTYAGKVINDTHFNYTAENRPRFMRSDLMRVLSQFKLYSQHVTYLQWRAIKQAMGATASAEEKAEARRFLLMQTGVQLMAGGVLGLPLGIWATAAVGAGGMAAASRYGWAGAMGYAATVIGAAVILAGDDEDDPREWEAEFQQAMAQWLGSTGGEGVSKGLVNALVGIDLSPRVSQGELWWRSLDADLDDKELWGEILQQVAGAGLGTGASIIQGLQLAADGHVERGIEKMVPKATKDVLQALRFTDEGAKTLKGDTLIEDISPWELTGKAAGFTPARLSQRYDENSAEKRRQRKIEDRRRELVGQVADARIAATKARQAGDMGEVEDAQETASEGMTAIQRFNQINPGLRITPKTIQKSVKSRNQARLMAQNGVFLNRKLQRQYDYAE